jgi:plastocyanin domain-containing protein
MHAIDWLAIAGGASAIAWVLWYFFAAERGAAVAALAPAAGADGVQEATVTVRGGYSPSTVRARAGRPLRLTFDRQEDAGCSEEVVFADFGLRRYLPANQRTTVEVTPAAPGTYEFTCGMGMLRGRLVAE